MKKVINACKSCNDSISCENIFKKSSVTICEYCIVKSNCMIRNNVNKYVNIFLIVKEGFCDKCYNEQCESGHA